MKELVVDTLKIVAPISVALVVFSQGLGISPSVVAAYWKDRPGLMARSLVAALVIVPAVALVVILLLKPAPGVAIGLAILVSCPPAPLTISSAPRQGGASGSFMVSLHLSLAILALLTVPAALYLLSIAFDFNAEVNLGVMAWILAKTILLPIGSGPDIARHCARTRRPCGANPRQGRHARRFRRGVPFARGRLSQLAAHGSVVLSRHGDRQHRSARHGPLTWTRRSR